MIASAALQPLTNSGTPSRIIPRPARTRVAGHGPRLRVWRAAGQFLGGGWLLTGVRGESYYRALSRIMKGCPFRVGC
jgi:hypothetical protein